MKTQPIFLSALLAAALLVSSPAHAGKPNRGQAAFGFALGWTGSDQDGAISPLGRFDRSNGFQMAQQSRVPLSQVIANINAIEPGQQLDTQLINDNGRAIYVIRWQASRGRIIIFRVDAETGQILGRQG